MPSGPFFSIAPGAIPGGFDRVPPGGVCVSTFLFVRDARGRVLLGQYADDPRWRDLVGLDAERIRHHAQGWTIPASHNKIGEDPRDAARRIAQDILGLRGLVFEEPRVATETYELARLPGERHFDVLLLVGATAPEADVRAPPWYAELAWQDLRALPPSAYGRGHEDVAAHWIRSHP